MSLGGIRRRNNPIDDVNFCPGKDSTNVRPQLTKIIVHRGLERRLMKFIDFLSFFPFSFMRRSLIFTVSLFL